MCENPYYADKKVGMGITVWKGYKIAEPPTTARSNFLKDMGAGEC